MKITRISIYQADLPLREGSYSWSNQSFSSFDTTIVVVDTDAGISSFGEYPLDFAPHAEGVRTGIAKLSRTLVGQDQRQLSVVNGRMDRALEGHPYVKSALNTACLDLRRKACGQPVYNLLGGFRQERAKLFSRSSVETTLSDGR